MVSRNFLEKFLLVDGVRLSRVIFSLFFSDPSLPKEIIVDIFLSRTS